MPLDEKRIIEIVLLSEGYKKYLSHSFHSLGYDYMMLSKEYVDRMGAAVQEFVKKLQAEDYQVSSEVVWAHPRYEVIVEKADEFNADLVAQHWRVHAKIEHYSLTNDSWQLVQNCNRPLLWVKEMEWSEQPMLMAAMSRSR